MKNKSLIMSIVSAAAGVLGLVFLALPFVTEISGYNMLKLLGYVNGAPFTWTMIYLPPLFILIATVVLLAFSVVNILGATNVIKSDKFLKASKIVTLVAASVFALFAVLAVIFLLIEEFSPAVGLILLLIVAIAALVGSILDLVWSKK